MFKKHYRKIKRQFEKAAKGDVSDHRIGISFAIGTFLAILPISVASVAICLFLALTVKYLNKISLFIPLIFWNPVWHLIFAYPARQIGKHLLQSHIDIITSFFGSGYAERIVLFGLYYSVGMCIIALYMAILSYFVVRLLVKLYRIRKMRLKELSVSQH